MLRSIYAIMPQPAIAWTIIFTVIPALAAAIVHLYRANQRLHSRIEALLREQEKPRVRLLLEVIDEQLDNRSASLSAPAQDTSVNTPN